MELIGQEKMAEVYLGETLPSNIEKFSILAIES